jgi:hypothetical protein
VPGLKDGDPGTDVPEAERQGHDIVHDLDRGTAAGDAQRATAGKGDRVDAVFCARLHEDRAPLLLERLLGQARRKHWTESPRPTTVAVRRGGARAPPPSASGVSRHLPPRVGMRRGFEAACLRRILRAL